MEENENLDPIYKDNALTKPRTYPRMKKRMKRIVQYIENRCICIFLYQFL